MIYRLKFDGSPPLKNSHRNPGTGGQPRRGSFMGDTKLSALAQLRKQNLWAPLVGDVVMLVVERAPNGRRDVAAGLAEVMDALEGSLYVNDRQVRMTTCGVDRKASALCWEVWAMPWTGGPGDERDWSDVLAVYMERELSCRGCGGVGLTSVGEACEVC